MSLIRQLWLAIVVLMVLAFGTSLVVSTLSARHYLEQQLRVKNLDNATSLALSLTQMPKDPVTIELQIAAQFDAGHYQRIRLTDPRGQTIVAREFDGPAPAVPAWFMALAPIQAEPGTALVQDGWSQFGSLVVESQASYAYVALWEGTVELFVWFLAGALISGLLGTVIVRRITQPLDGVVAQAEAIGERRFITTREPTTAEFRSLVRAMNRLSERVRGLLAEESQRLEALRRQNQLDAVTGLYHRNQFMNLLDAALAREDLGAGGVLLVVRIQDLGRINQALGHARTDALLASMGARLRQLVEPEPDWHAGRLNNTDFAVLAGGLHYAEEITSRLEPLLHDLVNECPSEIGVQMPAGASEYQPGEARQAVLARVDTALAQAEQRGSLCVLPSDAVDSRLNRTPEQWRAVLSQALAQPGVSLAAYPVVDRQGMLLHHECPARLSFDGHTQTAGSFMPAAGRSGLLPTLDLAVLKAALARIASTDEPTGINLSTDALRDPAFRAELLALLPGVQRGLDKLWIELPEHGVLRNLAEFRALCLALKPLGCKLGIEHVGHEFARIGDLHDLGLDYLKVDASLIRGIEHDAGNQNFLRGLATVAHAIGMLVIAEGVQADTPQALLAELGLDGFTGPGVQTR